MQTTTSDTQPYLLPGNLSPFQGELYRHLIDWKRRHITYDPGKVFRTKGGETVEYLYDAILPAAFKAEQRWPHLHPAAAAELERHRVQNGFRLHNHFYHMASSQAANLNLFLPLLLSPSAHAVLGAIKPDFATLATDYLDKGYCVEYWGGNFADHSGGLGKASPLRDKTGRTGTDSDIAIAYRNHAGELCLWLVEHKLTETEFTACGGARSEGRTARHSCEGSFEATLADKGACYYHDVNRYAYWEITHGQAPRALRRPRAAERLPLRGRAEPAVAQPAARSCHRGAGRLQARLFLGGAPPGQRGPRHIARRIPEADRAPPELLDLHLA